MIELYKIPGHFIGIVDDRDEIGAEYDRVEDISSFTHKYSSSLVQ